MFDAVRNNKRFVQIFLALIVLPFAFWGVESYVSTGGPGAEVATVGDSKITTREFQEALGEQRDELRKAMGANFNPAMLDSPAARAAMLDQLVSQRLLLIEARQRNIVTSDEMLRNFIASIPSLQENGKFSMSRYEELLRARSMSQAGFEYQLRQDLLMRQIAGAVGDTGILARTAADSMLTAMAEKRTVHESLLLPGSFLLQAKVSDEELRKYYDANAAEFREPEQARAEFVVLSLDAMKAQVKVSDAEIKAWYDSHADSYRQPEERRASHILITADRKDAEARAKARAKAEEILVQVKARSTDFGKLAKQHSQDPGSAANDGDLGFFARGMMVKSFDDAVFSLKDKEISPLVESDFGFHIIQLTGINPGKSKALDEVRAEIDNELRQQAAQKQFAEATEAFSNMVYEQPESLKPVVEKFGLPLQQSAWLIKGAPAAPGSPFANPKLAAAIFSSDALEKKRNTEAVEIARSTLVAARILEHKPAAQKAFDSVQTALRARLVGKAAAALAVKAGEARLAGLNAGQDDGANWNAAQNVGRTAPGTLTPEAVREIFRVPTTKLPTHAGVVLKNGGYALYRLTAVDTTGKLEENVAKTIRDEMTEVVAREEMSAYLAALREKHPVQINKTALEAK